MSNYLRVCRSRFDHFASGNLQPKPMTSICPDPRTSTIFLTTFRQTCQDIFKILVEYSRSITEPGYPHHCSCTHAPELRCLVAITHLRHLNLKLKLWSKRRGPRRNTCSEQVLDFGATQAHGSPSFRILEKQTNSLIF